MQRGNWIKGQRNLGNTRVIHFFQFKSQINNFKVETVNLSNAKLHFTRIPQICPFSEVNMYRSSRQIKYLRANYHKNQGKNHCKIEKCTFGVNNTSPHSRVNIVKPSGLRVNYITQLQHGWNIFLLWIHYCLSCLFACTFQRKILIYKFV
jgi:hypothetical protein